MKKLKIEKSLFPEGKKTHLVVLYSLTEHGIGTKRIFKGSYNECKEYKKELENDNQDKRI